MKSFLLYVSGFCMWFIIFAMGLKACNHELKQNEIKKYFPPEYDEQKIRTVICQLLEEWSNQNH